MQSIELQFKATNYKQFKAQTMTLRLSIVIDNM